MKLKIGLTVGFALGYYFGTAAGKERHVQLQNFVSKVTSSGPVSAASEQVVSVADTQFTRAKDKVAHKLHRKNLGETVEFMPS